MLMLNKPNTFTSAFEFYVNLTCIEYALFFVQDFGNWVK